MAASSVDGGIEMGHLLPGAIVHLMGLIASHVRNGAGEKLTVARTKRLRHRRIVSDILMTLLGIPSASKDLVSGPRC
ncbi:hypothetical protein PG997_013690 [Apiospora hydei]|uniref:Uncharacterized protein n=1 Tax=Apiospora hydei TaxID=1337664 RepID=A0ABR1V6W8_9PEZI